MLPLTLFEHLTRTSSLRGSRPGQERRENQRVPLRGMARVLPVEHGRLGVEVQTRLKDLSRSGLAFLAPMRLHLSGPFVAGLPTPSGGVLWVWCQSSRQQSAGGKDRVVCGRFLRILVPGQTPVTGVTAASFKWLGVEPAAEWKKSA